MKKLILSAAVIAATAVGANAQLSLNPEAGVNFANMTDGDMITAWKAGALVNIGVYKGFYIEPGIFYSVKGTKATENIPPLGTVEAKMNLNYLEIPVNLGYRYDFANAGGIFVTAGPYMGIGLNGKAKVSSNGMSADADLKAGDDFERIDFGLNFSLGYMSPWGVYIRGQYGLGLKDAVEGGSSKHSVIGVSLGYAFMLNER